jgi:hypothetical protein
MATGTLAPVAHQQFLSLTGQPLAGGQLFTYLTGTSTPSPVYQDALLQVPQTNPLILDAGGFADPAIYMPPLAQKWVLFDQFGNLQWSVDPVGSIGLNASGVYEVFNFGGDPTSPITATTYPAGATFAQCHAGTNFYSMNSASIALGTYVLSAMLASPSGAIVTVALVNLSGSSPNTPIATCASISPTGQVVQSAAIAFQAPGTVQVYGIKAQIVSGSGFAWGICLVKVA